MSTDEFWEIVDHAHSLSPDDMKMKCKNLDTALRKLPVRELIDFGRHFARFYYDAYRWDVWAAAFIIGQGWGCSDDSFMDFRSTLISMGRSVYANALANPDSLAETNMHPSWAKFEGYQYVASTIMREILESDELPPDLNLPQEKRTHPHKPVGEPFNQWELSAKYPKLCAKFGHKDSAYFGVRDRLKREEQKQHSAEAIAELLLRAQIIPPNGLVAPYKILRSVLQSGSASELTGSNVTWEPFDLDEGIYWAVLHHLERLPAEKLATYPHLKVATLKHDVTTNAASFSDWYRSAL